MFQALEGARFTPLSLSMLLLWVFKATTSYTEQKEVETRMGVVNENKNKKQIDERTSKHKQIDKQTQTNKINKKQTKNR